MVLNGLNFGKHFQNLLKPYFGVTKRFQVKFTKTFHKHSLYIVLDENIYLTLIK